MIVNTGIFMLTAAGIGLLIWAGICVLTILYKSHQAERHDQRYTAGGTILGFAVTGVIGQVLYWIAAAMILKGVASSTVMMLQSKAQSVYSAAQEYTAQPGHDTITSVSGSNLNSYEYAYDSMEAAIIRSFSFEQKPYWFVVTVDGNGNVLSAYFAYHEPKKGELKPANTEEQEKLLMNPLYSENDLVGSWTVSDQKRNEKIWGTTGDEE